MSREKVPAIGYCVREKVMICVCPAGFHTKNLWQNAEKGKKTCAEPSTRFPETWGCTDNVLPWSTKGMRIRDEKLDSRAAKKGIKKFVSSNFAKILE
jgi:hypothetical protein